MNVMPAHRQLGLLLLVGMGIHISAHTAKSASVEKRSIYSAAEVLKHSLDQIGTQSDLFRLISELEEAENVAELPNRLASIAAAQGAFARPFNSWRMNDLYEIDPAHHIILKVRPAIDHERTDHYVMLEKADDDRVTLYTGASEPLQMSMYDLMHLWGGSGIIVSEEPLESAVANSAQRRTSVTGAVALAGLTAFLIGLIRRRGLRVSRSFWTRACGEAAMIVLIPGVVTTVTFAVTGNQRLSFMYGAALHQSDIVIDLRNDVNPVYAARVGTDYKDLTREELRQLLTADQVLWIDARKEEGYAQQRIQGALLLDNFDLATVRLRLAGLDRDQAIVVYCSHEHCGRGRAAAGALAKAGFSRVYHYPPGWADLSNWDELAIIRGKPPVSSEIQR